MASFDVASLFVVLLVASCVLNTEAVKCGSDKDCRTECPQGGFCHVQTGECICLPTSRCAKDSDCIEPCSGFRIHKCKAGRCVCQ
ncbi:hypothetical protein HRI_003060800 [Hibiscus trionum]|uniref:Uncharacterized protein n=1 Tax=Hibiscus trionum TaxID=183268 RepID=A0A9W7ICN8_HIBTR|nr:hypothetical protein HRI_003060800 [Hibiscus trionum]